MYLLFHIIYAFTQLYLIDKYDKYPKIIYQNIK